MKNKILVVLSLLLVVAVGFSCMASADTYEYKPVFQYGVEYKVSWSAGGSSGSWLQSFSSSDLYPFYFWGDFSSGVDRFTLGIAPQESSQYIIAFGAGQRVTFKYRIYATRFELLNASGIQNWFDFVSRTGSSGSTVHTYNYMSYGEPVSSAGKFYRDFEVTIDNESSEQLYFIGFRVGVTSYNSDWTYSGSIGCAELRYHIWTDAEIINSKQTEAINKQTETITKGWVQGDVTPPAGSDTVDDFGAQESALLDGQADGLAAGKQLFSDALTSFKQYQGAFLGVAKMIMDFVNMSPAFSFIFYTSLSLGLCCFVLCLGNMISRSMHERAGKGKGS